MFSTEVPPDESLIEFFTSAFDGNIYELRDLVNQLSEITDRVERIHRNTTIGSLTGGVIGAAGGITSIVGLILVPFTLGASLIVTGVGIGVAVAGGVTGAGANITDMVHQKTSREEIETILEEFQSRLSPIIKSLQDIKLRLDEIQRDGLTDPSTQRAQIGFGVGRGAGYAAEFVRLINFVEIGKVAAQVSRTMRAAGAITGVFSGVFLLMDIVFIVKDAKELYEIDKDQKDGSGNSAISQFIQKMKETVDHLNQTLDKLKEA
ncbi:apolipoprotein L3-like [Salminus brasiliensis]|uniref:apolipoprotein L3-like n=1 Tax=Salminus brasiliensis TaxID=930266 RepID=UPI003B8389CE